MVIIPPEHLKPIKYSTITLDSFLELTKQRRSYRIFKDKEVPKPLLIKIIESTKYLPTGCNLQELEYTVLTNTERIKSISKKMNSKFKLIKFLTNHFPVKIFFKLFKEPERANRNIIGPERLTTAFKEGYDSYLREAPVVIIIHTGEKTEMMHLDAGIAGHHINLACETEGLGACWIGFHSELSRFFPSIKKLSLIPRKHKILATLVVGYPKLKYLRECPRNNTKYHFIEK